MLENLSYLVGGGGLLFTVFTGGYMISNKNKNNSFVQKDHCNEYQKEMIEKINEVQNIVSRIEGKLEGNDHKKQ